MVTGRHAHGVGLAAPRSSTRRTGAAAARRAPLRRPLPSSPSRRRPDFTRIAGQTVKAVANISSLQVVRRPNSPFANDPFFRYFFGDQDVFGSRDRRSLSLGSGVIVSRRRLRRHQQPCRRRRRRAIRESRSRCPTSARSRRVIVGTDPATDIALLKIDVKGLPAIPWGDSSKLQVGEWVLAIGSPFQLSQTVTAGIVSATGRANVGFADYEDFIQTDAAINPGNSGGALINTRGELVGINTGIFSQSGGYQGIGFAVPSNLAQRIVDDLMKFGEVRRGTIGGISIEPLTPDIAEELGAPNTKGALVVRAIRDTGGFDAGLRPGDIIVGFNGRADRRSVAVVQSRGGCRHRFDRVPQRDPCRT